MKSIWSKNYITYKNSNPFTGFISSSKRNEVTLINTNTSGLVKTLNNRTLSLDPVSNKENMVKRKFDTIESSNLKTVIDELEKDELGNQSEKKFKKSESSLDIDSLLTSYSGDKETKSSQIKIESSYESSGYFSSSSNSNGISSPILNKVN